MGVYIQEDSDRIYEVTQNVNVVSPLINHGLTAQRKGPFFLLIISLCLFYLLLTFSDVCSSRYCFSFPFLVYFSLCSYLMIVFAFSPLSLCIEAPISANSHAETSTTLLISMDTIWLVSCVSPAFAPLRRIGVCETTNGNETDNMGWGMTLLITLFFSRFIFQSSAYDMGEIRKWKYGRDNIFCMARYPLRLY